jgi:hypothetical protein
MLFDSTTQRTKAESCDNIISTSSLMSCSVSAPNRFANHLDFIRTRQVSSADTTHILDEESVQESDVTDPDLSEAHFPSYCGTLSVSTALLRVRARTNHPIFSLHLMTSAQ